MQDARDRDKYACKHLRKYHDYICSLVTIYMLYAIRLCAASKSASLTMQRRCGAIATDNERATSYQCMRYPLKNYALTYSWIRSVFKNPCEQTYSFAIFRYAFPEEIYRQFRLISER